MHRADDEKQVGLPRRETGQAGAEAVDVEVGAGRRHVLHAAAGGDERIVEERELPAPAEGRFEAGRDEVESAHDQRKIPFFQA